MPVPERLVTFLVQNGESVTVSRKSVFMAMFEPGTVAELTRKSGFPVATVYRTVRLFLKLGIAWESQPGVYELTDKFAPHRHYKVCTQCGRRTAFMNPAVEKALAKMDASHRLGGFRVEGHTLEFTGICGLCRAG